MNTAPSFDSATQLRATATPANLSAGLELLADFADRAAQLDSALAGLAEVAGDSTTRSVERLRTTLAEFEPEPLPIHIVHPEGRSASAKVRAFVDLARESIRGNPYLNP